MRVCDVCVCVYVCVEAVLCTCRYDFKLRLCMMCARCVHDIVPCVFEMFSMMFKRCLCIFAGVCCRVFVRFVVCVCLCFNMCCVCVLICGCACLNVRCMH